MLYLHRIIIEKTGLVIPINMEADHRDRNKLNNQRENLRIVTREINSHNKGLNSNNTSGMKGVSFYSRINKWVAEIHINGRKISLGCFLTFEEAVSARLKAEQKYKRFINPV